MTDESRVSDEIKEGDVVTLRHGGPRVTVGQVFHTGGVTIYYWSEEGSLVHCTVPPVVLKKVSE